MIPGFARLSSGPPPSLGKSGCGGIWWFGRVHQTGEQVGELGLGVDPGTVEVADEGVEGGGLDDPLRNIIIAPPQKVSSFDPNTALRQRTIPYKCEL